MKGKDLPAEEMIQNQGREVEVKVRSVSCGGVVETVKDDCRGSTFKCRIFAD